ncbi:MAG: SDR family oxidoreductase [Woeseiaceae bacterium]|nr:SDR family oxidoreductase [Woeseiaceae bacterium]
MATWVITGCNRGIGLELARQASERGEDVIGVCRQPSDELNALGLRVVDGIDVTDPDGVSRLASALGDTTIDVLINNAGILRRDSLDDLDYDGMLEQFRVNTLGPLRVTTALLDRLGEGSKVAIITSRMGSIDDNSSGGYYGYRVSKAGVNMVGKSLAKDLEDRGIAVALLHPGMVATDMTGGNGIDPRDSARGLIARIDELGMQTSGHFWHGPEGEELPW